MEIFKNLSITDYDEYQNITLENINKAGGSAPSPEVVAKVVFYAANDSSNKLRYIVGMDSKFLLLLRKILPTLWFMRLIRMVIERKH